jgi:hypothetical protein
MSRSRIGTLLVATTLTAGVVVVPGIAARAAPPIQPSVRFGAGMANDATHGQVVLFGGIDGSVLGDTWTWDGASWTEHTLSTPPPLGVVRGWCTTRRLTRSCYSEGRAGPAARSATAASGMAPTGPSAILRTHHIPG